MQSNASSLKLKHYSAFDQKEFSEEKKIEPKFFITTVVAKSIINGLKDLRSIFKA